MRPPADVGPSPLSIYPDSPRTRTSLLQSTRSRIHLGGLIRPGFLDIESRRDLIDLARDGSTANRLARRANALVLLDDGMSCAAIAKVLLLDDDTIRTWWRLYREDGIGGLASFGYEGGTGIFGTGHVNGYGVLGTTIWNSLVPGNGGLGVVGRARKAASGSFPNQDVAQGLHGIGLYGETDVSDGVFGFSSAVGGRGVVGQTNAPGGTGVVGGGGATGTGVLGASVAGTGVVGSSTNGAGVRGTSSSDYGVHGSSVSEVGVHGSSSSGYGVVGTTDSWFTAGVRGNWPYSTSSLLRLSSPPFRGSMSRTQWPRPMRNPMFMLPPVARCQIWIVATS